MSSLDIDAIFDAIRNTKSRGEQPDTIVMSEKVYNRMFVPVPTGKMRGNAHDRRLYKRAINRRNAQVKQMREYMGL